MKNSFHTEKEKLLTDLNNTTNLIQSLNNENNNLKLKLDELGNSCHEAKDTLSSRMRAKVVAVEKSGEMSIHDEIGNLLNLLKMC